MKKSNLAAVVLGLSFLASSLSAKEPANLSPLKQEIRAYLDSGEYERDIAAVTTPAALWLEQRVKQGGGKLAIVFDLDETLISNLPVMRSLDFGYVPTKWDAWVAEGKAPVIAPTAELYRTARKLGLEVIFLTGRRERDRAGTEKNLKEIGCDTYTALIFKPDASKETTGAFKLAERRQLVAEGYVIVASIGDQDSDFEGGLAEKNFKLPNPFYLTK